VSGSHSNARLECSWTGWGSQAGFLPIIVIDFTFLRASLAYKPLLIFHSDGFERMEKEEQNEIHQRGLAISP
jgi:hypothetical protein